MEVVTQYYTLPAAWRATKVFVCLVQSALIRNGYLLVILKQMHISAWEDVEFLPD